MNEIKPALTNEEWALHEGTSPTQIHNAHAIAAVHLYRQPFGFTWEDVDFLREQASIFMIAFPYPPGGGSIPSTFNSIADRIQAFLPPKEKK